MSARPPYRFKLKAWYGLLVVIWILTTLPVAAFVIVMGEAAADAPPRLAQLLDMFGRSFALMRPDPLSIALSAWLWLPILAAPFGLFARIAPASPAAPPARAAGNTLDGRVFREDEA